MSAHRSALLAGLLALGGGTLAHFAMPHVVDSNVLRGIGGALLTGVVVFGGLTVLE